MEKPHGPTPSELKQQKLDLILVEQKTYIEAHREELIQKALGIRKETGARSYMQAPLKKAFEDSQLTESVGSGLYYELWNEMQRRDQAGGDNTQETPFPKKSVMSPDDHHESPRGDTHWLTRLEQDEEERLERIEELKKKQNESQPSKKTEKRESDEEDQLGFE